MGRGAKASVLTTNVIDEGDSDASVIANVAPNPASDNVNVEFFLSSGGMAIVSLVDVTGRTVSTFDAGVLAAGTHQTSFDVTSLPAGTYTITIRGQRQNISVPIVVVR
jgi:hypothetical protein